MRRFEWLRHDHHRLRPATPADTPALAALADTQPARTAAPTPLPRSDGPAGPELRRHVLERDGQIAAALTTRSARLTGSPLQPWSERATAPIAPTSEGDWLQITDLVAPAGLTAAPLLDAPLKTLVQRRSFSGAVALVCPRPGATDLSDAPMTAYLQQLVYRAVDDPAIAPWLAAGFRLEGWWDGAEDRQPVVMMAWNDGRV